VKHETTIIPFASGKGGVGKSFITANVAIALAELGHETIVVDLDLGGSNLYTFLGLTNRYPGIGDFLKARDGDLGDLVVPTAQSGLFYLSGDGRTPFMANIPYAQKVRLASSLKKLSAEYILLDLSAGSSFNTIDFFRLSPFGALVTVPEYTAIMNLLTFLKLTLIRSIERYYFDNDRIRALLAEEYKRPMGDVVQSIDQLKSRLSGVDSGVVENIDRLCRRFRPRLIFNSGEHPDDMLLYRQIDKGLRSVLSLEVDYFGFIYRDPAVRETINAQVPYLAHCPDHSTAKSIRRVAERIVKYWKKPVDGSAQMIHAGAEQSFQNR
jgi:flagellar biosynthesis protein FlhG